uniref:Uncharacterized protein n=1 Tax=Arundo donax TaxID=35708 RepID=A0A0A9HF49_ARUDO
MAEHSVNFYESKRPCDTEHKDAAATCNKFHCPLHLFSVLKLNQYIAVVSFSHFSFSYTMHDLFRGDHNACTRLYIELYAIYKNERPFP